MGIAGSSSPTAQNGETRGSIVISHTNQEGTLVSGTARGDGSRDALRVAGFRWSRNLGVWCMRQSRGFPARSERIDALASALRAIGFTVTVNIAEYDPSSTFQARQEAGHNRAAAHAARAARQQQLSKERYDAARDAVAGIPFGQPVLVGHHSERRHRRALERQDRNMGKAAEHSRNAREAARRSDAVSAEARARENPVVMGRRVARLRTELRQLTRSLQNATGAHAEQLQARHHVVEADLAFLHQAIERSGARIYTPADIEKGDLVQLGRRGWQLVVKVNQKTIAVKTPYSWTDKYPYHEITGHRRPGN